MHKGINLSVHACGDPVYIYADPVRIKQIIGNLLQNAYKYTQTGGEAALGIYRENAEAIISVKDNGIGISPELMPMLFMPFLQADTSLDRSGGGLGLGLSIVKGIMGLHGGSVSAHSDGLGKGTEFTVRLPIADVQGRQETDASGRGGNSTQAQKILLIEDNRDFANLLSIMLSTIGYSVSIAFDGMEGLKLAKRIKPDVVFCHIGLPGMNGYDVAESIRKDGELKNIYLIALTGYAGAGDAEHAEKSGFQKHLAKPIDVNTLKNVLHEATDFHSALKHE